MQYNSHATNQDLVTLSNKLSNQNDTSFPLVEKTLYANIAERIIMSTIHEAYGGWKYDDKNQTDLPIATAHLVSGQEDYALPSDSSFIDAVYIQQENESTWFRVKPLPLEWIGNEQDFMTTDSDPAYYRLIGDSIKLYPAPNYAKNNALKIEYSRDISGFTTTDTTTAPAFDSQFHEAVAVYMAWQFAIAKKLSTQEMLGQQWLDFLARISKHYTQKWKDMYPPKFHTQDTLQDYI
jgi:hypothetical protein